MSSGIYFEPDRLIQKLHSFGLTAHSELTLPRSAIHYWPNGVHPQFASWASLLSVHEEQLEHILGESDWEVAKPLPPLGLVQIFEDESEFAFQDLLAFFLGCVPFAKGAGYALFIPVSPFHTNNHVLGHFLGEQKVYHVSNSIADWLEQKMPSQFHQEAEYSLDAVSVSQMFCRGVEYSLHEHAKRLLLRDKFSQESHLSGLEPHQIVLSAIQVLSTTSVSIMKSYLRKYLSGNTGNTKESAQQNSLITLHPLVWNLSEIQEDVSKLSNSKSFAWCAYVHAYEKYSKQNLSSEKNRANSELESFASSFRDAQTAELFLELQLQRTLCDSLLIDRENLMRYVDGFVLSVKPSMKLIIYERLIFQATINDEHPECYVGLLSAFAKYCENIESLLALEDKFGVSNFSARRQHEWAKAIAMFHNPAAHRTLRKLSEPYLNELNLWLRNYSDAPVRLLLERDVPETHQLIQKILRTADFSSANHSLCVQAVETCHRFQVFSAKVGIERAVKERLGKLYDGSRQRILRTAQELFPDDFPLWIGLHAVKQNELPGDEQDSFECRCLMGISLCLDEEVSSLYLDFVLTSMENYLRKKRGSKSFLYTIEYTIEVLTFRGFVDRMAKIRFLLSHILEDSKEGLLMKQRLLRETLEWSEICDSSASV